MPLPEVLTIYAKDLSTDAKGRMLMSLDAKLLDAIEIRWQGILAKYPGLIATDDRIGKLVRDLFKELQELYGLLWLEMYWVLLSLSQPTISDIKGLIFLRVSIDRLQANPKYKFIKQYWRSFLFSITLRTASTIHRTIGLPLSDVRLVCVGETNTTDSPAFFKNYKDTDLDRNLLSNLQSYAFNKLKNSSYPSLRIEFNDDTIGRGNPGMITYYKSSIAAALRWIGKDEATNEILDEIKIQQKVDLCKWTIEYLSTENRKRASGNKLQINKLNSSDFDKIRNLYCKNISQFKYLQEINRGEENKENCLKIENLNLLQKEELGKLYRQLSDNLPSSIDDELENIGAIIRRYIKRNRDLPYDDIRKGGVKFIETIESKTVTPQELIEEKEIEARSNDIIPICDKWFSSKEGEKELNLDRKRILYLIYSGLVYEQIAPIFNITYTNISRPVRKIHVKIAEFVTEEINKEDCTIYRKNKKQVILSVSEILKTELDRLKIGENLDRNIILVLEPLISKYKRYLAELREEYYKLRPIMISNSVKTSEYQKQLNILNNLSLEQYPELNRNLTTASFSDLIKEIKIPLSKL
jgi:hypothetical protein